MSWAKFTYLFFLVELRFVEFQDQIEFLNFEIIHNKFFSITVNPHNNFDKKINQILNWLKIISKGFLFRIYISLDFFVPSGVY